MKNRIKRWAVVAGVMASAWVSEATQWVYAPMTVPSALGAVTATPLTNYSGAGIQIPQNVPVVITATIAGNATNVQPVVLGFDVSTDNINFSTTQPFKFTNSQPGVVSGVFTMQLTAAQLAGFQYVKFTYTSEVSATASTNYGVTLAYPQ